MKRLTERNFNFDTDFAASHLQSWSIAQALKKLQSYEDAEEQGLLVWLPCKQYTTVYYILDQRIYAGWYLAQVDESTHLILQDRFEMGICWMTDGMWFLTCEAAEAALAEMTDTSAKVVHGKWIWADDGYLRCSECRQKAPVMMQYQDDPQTVATLHCPNCGAKMDGESRESEGGNG